MTKYPFHRSITNFSEEQLKDLVMGYQRGELTKPKVEGDTVYYQKARKNHWSLDEIAEKIEPFRPGPTDPAERLVPRQAAPLQAAKACEAAAGLEPDYTGENEREPADWFAMVALWLISSMAGALLAIAYQAWKPS